MNSIYFDAKAAQKMATDALGNPPIGVEYSFVILTEYTIERPTCFVFFYESSRYLETGAFEDRLAGNAPILVDRRTGELHFLGTAEPVEFYIKEFERTEK